MSDAFVLVGFLNCFAGRKKDNHGLHRDHRLPMLDEPASAPFAEPFAGAMSMPSVVAAPALLREGDIQLIVPVGLGDI